MTDIHVTFLILAHFARIFHLFYQQRLSLPLMQEEHIPNIYQKYLKKYETLK